MLAAVPVLVVGWPCSSASWRVIVPAGGGPGHCGVDPGPIEGGDAAGSDLSFEDSQEDEFEDEDVIQVDGEGNADDDWEDCDDAATTAKNAAK